MLYIKQATPQQSGHSAIRLPAASHEKAKHYRVKQGAQHKDSVHSTVKGQPHSNRCSSHSHDDALAHANNQAISNFIGGHQLDRWPVNQSLASLSKRQQFRSAGKPPNKQSVTTSAPRPLSLSQKKKRNEEKIKKHSQRMSVTYLGCLQKKCTRMHMIYFFMHNLL